MTPSKPAPKRGEWAGLCATDGCPQQARWIPVSHVSTQPQPFRYFCGDCCDEIDALAQQRVRYCTYHETVHADLNHESAVCRIMLR